MYVTTDDKGYHNFDRNGVIHLRHSGLKIFDCHQNLTWLQTEKLGIRKVDKTKAATGNFIMSLKFQRLLQQLLCVGNVNIHRESFVYINLIMATSCSKVISCA